MNKKPKLIIVGNTNLAELTTYYLQEDYDIIAYAVDKAYIKSATYLNKPLVDFKSVEKLYSPSE